MANTAAQAFIAFLRCEAQQAEDRAKSLRMTAAAIEANNLEARRKQRKRDHSGGTAASATKTRGPQSAYTYFVQENYELLKKDRGDLPSREIISILARQWAETSEEEKQLWKYRAEQARIQSDTADHYPANQGMMPIYAAGLAEAGEEEEEERESEEESDEDLNDDAKQQEL